MHFVTGGAFNGKAKWVREFYQLKEKSYLWISAYNDNPLPDNSSEWHKSNLLILEGIELWVKALSEQADYIGAKEKWRGLLRLWQQWEKGSVQREVILIGTDITKGIVPMLSEERKWRDMTGWIYQDITAAANRADIIWYGISQQIK